MILPSKSPYHHIWTDFLNGNLEICVSSEILLEYEEIIPEKISSHFAFILMEALTNCQNLIRITPAWRFDLIKKDPDGNKFVDCAVCGMAEYTVSVSKGYGSFHYGIYKRNFKKTPIKKAPSAVPKALLDFLFFLHFFNGRVVLTPTASAASAQPCQSACTLARCSPCALLLQDIHYVKFLQ